MVVSIAAIRKEEAKNGARHGNMCVACLGRDWNKYDAPYCCKFALPGSEYTFSAHVKHAKCYTCAEKNRDCLQVWRKRTRFGPELTFRQVPAQFTGELVAAAALFDKYDADKDEKTLAEANRAGSLLHSVILE